MKKLRKHEQVLLNRAEPDIDGNNQGAPATVGETVTFAMKDKHHRFSLDLETVLGCLAFAEDQGAVPALPDGWWLMVKQRYHV
ncbi:hypothetical protein [Pararhodobacter sp.]|uniref:hypothetical protein n=1 Tax=Pararhodobacter sp. TaxID=2127056 RepID=UPI002AFE423C|nr:hypothetical protein [Pararhodobacter sp.]